MAKIFWYQKKAIQTIEKNAQKGLKKACVIAETEAKRLVAVDTGRLKSSITHRTSGLKGEIGSEVHYAAPQEFGTFKMRAHPYLRPAIVNKWEEIVRAIGEDLT